MIAPQHGFVNDGDLVGEFLERMYHLPVVGDLLEEDEQPNQLARYQEILNDIVASSIDPFSEDAVAGQLADTGNLDGLDKLASIDGIHVELAFSGRRALSLILARIGQLHHGAFAGLIKKRALDECLRWDLPLPEVSVGIEEDFGDKLSIQD